MSNDGNDERETSEEARARGARSLLGPATLHAAFEQAIARAGGGLDDVELSFEGGRQGTTRFARSQITQSGEVVERTLRARVRVGGAVGSARTSSIDDADGVIARAAAIARSRGSSEAMRAEFAAPASGPPDQRYRDAMARAWRGDTAGLGPADRAALLSRAIDVAARAHCHCAGTVATETREQAVVSTRGMRTYHRATTAKMDLIATHDSDDKASGRAAIIAHDAGKLAPESAAAYAVETAERSLGAIELPPGEIDVILEPPAVCEVLEWLSMTSFGANSVLDGSSCLAGRDGQPLCAPEITIYDDGLDPDPAALVAPADAEGVRKQRVPLIERGLARGPVLDTTSALKMGQPASASTGHATSLTDGWNDGSVAANIAMAAGPDSMEALIGRCDRALLVKRFHYVNGLIDTRRAVMTGMTRDGTFLVEKGEITRPVRNVRWTQSILDVLQPGRIGGITSQRRVVPVWWSPAGGFLVPALLLRGFRVTGGTPSR